MGDPATMEAMSNPRVLEAFQQVRIVLIFVFYYNFNH